jgi:hypothetical protein
MKLPHSPRGGCLFTGILALIGMIPQAFAANEIPTGKLNVDRTLVRVGTQSQLDWNIQYPSAGVKDVIEIVTPNIIKPKANLKMRVRVLGASFQESTTTYLPVEVMWSKNNASWTRAFYGKQTDVNPSKVVLDTTVKTGDIINFGGRGYRDKAWLPLYNTSTATPNLEMLTNGEKVPSTTPAFQQGLIESFLKPYLASDGKTVKIGDRDLILLLELGQTNPKVSGFDLQDLVILVTFE